MCMSVQASCCMKDVPVLIISSMLYASVIKKNYVQGQCYDYHCVSCMWLQAVILLCAFNIWTRRIRGLISRGNHRGKLTVLFNVNLKEEGRAKVDIKKSCCRWELNPQLVHYVHHTLPWSYASGCPRAHFLGICVCVLGLVCTYRSKDFFACYPGFRVVRCCLVTYNSLWSTICLPTNSASECTHVLHNKTLNCAINFIHMMSAYWDL